MFISFFEEAESSAAMNRASKVPQEWIAWVELPSDLHGLVTIHISEDVREKAEEIRRELRAAGYRIT